MTVYSRVCVRVSCIVLCRVVVAPLLVDLNYNRHFSSG